MIAIEAAPVRLALETKAVADVRRFREGMALLQEGLRALGEACRLAVQEFVKAIGPLVDRVNEQQANNRASARAFRTMGGWPQTTRFSNRGRGWR